MRAANLCSRQRCRDDNLTFDRRGGSEAPSIDVTSGTTITLPANSTKDNYTFVGWYLDEALNNVLDVNGAVCSNITVYAKWTENTKYTVTLVGGDGVTSTAPTIASQYVGASITLPANPAGWNYVGTYGSCHNKTGGTAVDVSDTAANATLFTKTQYTSYFYKV